MHARFSDHAGLAKCSHWRSWTYCLPRIAVADTFGFQIDQIERNFLRGI